MSISLPLTVSPVHCGQFPDIEHHFAIHNRSFNAEWLSILSSQGVLLSRENLDKLRDHQGSEVRIIVLAASAHALRQVAFYFAFVNFYSLWLVAATLAGLVSNYYIGLSEVHFKYDHNFP